MKNKISRGLKNLQKSKKDSPVSKFSFTELESGNSFKAKIFYNDCGLPDIKIYQNNGYEIAKLDVQLKASLDTLFYSPLPDVKSGSKIYTREPAKVGDILTLGIETYYYAVDLGVFHCAGRMLERSFQAKCLIDNYSAKCSATTEPATYTLFQLI